MRRSLFVLAAAALACDGGGLLGPPGAVLGIYRGREWGLAATTSSVAVYPMCEGHAYATAPVVWTPDHRFTANFEYSWNQNPGGVDIVVSGRRLINGHIELTAAPPFAEVDTLAPAPRADFYSDVACD